MKSVALWSAVLLLGVIPLGAVAEEEPEFMERLFAPELILENAKAIDLRPEQRRFMMNELKETQLRATEAQFGVYEAGLQLNELSEAAEIDEAAMVEAAREVFVAEGRVKEAHLVLLVRMRNALNAGQREQLVKIREAGR
jgi:hypothetical protein